MKTDMGGPALLGFAIDRDSAAARRPGPQAPGGVTLPDGGAGLTVSDARSSAEVARFLRGSGSMPRLTRARTPSRGR